MLNRRVILIGTFVGLTISVLHRSAPGDEAADASCPDHQTLFQGLREARLQLHSGVCKGTGHRVLRVDDTGTLEGPISFFCAFDDVIGKIRCDRVEPTVFTDPNEQRASVVQVDYKSIRLPDKTYFLDIGAGATTTDILSVETPEARPPQYGHPIDFRTLGLIDWASFDQGSRLEAVMKGLEKYRVTGVRKGPAGECIVTALPVDNVQLEFSIDSRRGFTVTHWEMRIRDPLTGKSGEVQSMADVTWSKVNGSWVPVSIQLERNFSGRETYVATMEWNAVNEDLPAALFEPASLGLDPNSIMVDRRPGDKNVVIKRIKDVGSPVAPQPVAPPGGHPWFLMGNAAALVLLAIYFIWRRYRRSPRMPQ